MSGNQCTVNMNTAIKNVTASFELSGGTVQPPPASTPTPSVTPKKKCKKAKKRSAVAAKKCKKK